MKLKIILIMLSIFMLVCVSSCDKSSKLKWNF